MKPGRNDPCHCGSGKKYKQCCLEKDDAAARKARESAAAEAPAAPAEGAAVSAKARDRVHEQRPWKRAANTRGFQRVAGTRKVGGG
jgi:hypothetical protein